MYQQQRRFYSSGSGIDTSSPVSSSKCHPRIIFLDIFDTLLRLRRHPADVYLEVACRHFPRATFDKEVARQAFKTSFKKMSRDHPNYGKLTQLGFAKQWWGRIISETLLHSARNLRRSDWQNLSDKTIRTLLNQFGTKEPYQLFPGVRRFFHLLSRHVEDKNTEIRLASNSDPQILSALKDLCSHDPILSITLFPSEYMDAGRHILSYDLDVMKPHPDFFTQALILNGLTLEDAPRTIFIGDSLEEDAIAAAKVGMQGVWLNRRRPSDEGTGRQELSRRIEKEEGALTGSVTHAQTLRDVLRLVRKSCT